MHVVSQYESFSVYRARVHQKSEAEMVMLKETPRLWNVHIVLNVLHSLIDKSNINEQLYSASQRSHALFCILL